MPAFTYCLQKREGVPEIFDSQKSPSRTGAVSEVFRKGDDVVRTSSPTHSFALWGAVTGLISVKNAPSSPLGSGSVLEWLAEQRDAFILMVGVDFASLSFLHYLEVEVAVPYTDFFPFQFLGKESVGVAVDGLQRLYQVPGCSHSFPTFENYLRSKDCIHSFDLQLMPSYYIPISVLREEGMPFLRTNWQALMCPDGSCNVCDYRRVKLFKLKE
jgi:hypothetical protein